jgi:hypothetical protein
MCPAPLGGRCGADPFDLKSKDSRMQTNLWPIKVLIILGVFCFMAATLGQGEDKSNATLQDQRKRLASLHAGMSSEQVVKLLGKPDEVRRVTEDLLDGTRLMGDSPDVGPETERWAYGILAKGMFARVGYVSLDRKGKVVAAISADCFSGPHWKLPEQVPARTDQAVESPSKMSCHVGSIRYVSAVGQTAERIHAKITVKNSGSTLFQLKHDAAYCVGRFLLIEVYDSTGVLLFRMDEMRYHSPINVDPARWPVLSIPPSKEMSEELVFSPAEGFGSLPAGKYSLRLYFPFENGKYHPSNLLRFEVKEDERKKLNDG